MSLRRTYRRARRKARFHFAVLLTIVVVAYVGVPHLARLVEAVSGYNPGHYEPKDVERGVWMQHTEGPRSSPACRGTRWSTSRSSCWWPWCGLTLVPPGHARRPPPR